MHINNGGDGYKAGCGKTWVDVTYIWNEVDCPDCLKLRPTNLSVDGGEVLPLHNHIYIDGKCACGHAIERHHD